MKDKVILVDEADREVGTGEKLETHQAGKLHRAFSIFVFNSKGALLLQRRTKTKYHSGGLWANTCCSHPRPGETTIEAAHRRLNEEMGFDCNLREIFSFTYQVKFENKLFEYEYDHVFMGKYDSEPSPNPEEVCDWKWIEVAELKRDIQENPGAYAYWLRLSIDRVIAGLGDVDYSSLN